MHLAERMQPTELCVSLTDAHIRAARRGPFDNPVALALSDTLEAAGFFPHGAAMVCVERGPGLTQILDSRASASSYEANTTWNARLFGCDIPMPKRCQMLLWVFSYGPGSGPFAVRDEDGAVIAMQPYESLVLPLDFSLTFLAPVPKHRSAEGQKAEGQTNELDMLEPGEMLPR